MREQTVCGDNLVKNLYNRKLNSLADCLSGRAAKGANPLFCAKKRVGKCYLLFFVLISLMKRI